MPPGKRDGGSLEIAVKLVEVIAEVGNADAERVREERRRGKGSLAGDEL